MAKMSVHEAKAHFSELLKRVEAGETIVVTRHDKPIVEIKAVSSGVPTRQLGIFDGWGDVPDEAFAPMTEEELKEWYGE